MTGHRLTEANKSFGFFFQKEALSFFLPRAAAPPPPRASGSFLKKRTKKRLFVNVCLALGLGCAGCAATDPYQRAGMWQPMGAVQGNLAAMVADPADLVMGHGDGQAWHFQSTLPLYRIWIDQPKPLLDAQAQGSGQSASGSGQSSSGSGAGAPSSGSPQLPEPASAAGGN